MSESKRTAQDIQDEIDSLREDGPDGLDGRAWEVWQQAIKDLEEEIANLNRANKGN